MMALYACSLSNDDEFGPRVNPHCRNFDFTLFFEDAIFSVLPAAILLLILPLRLIHLLRSPVKVISRRLAIYKVLALSSLLILQILFVILRHRKDLLHTRASVPAGAISTVATLVSICASVLENHRTVRPSYILVLYFSTSTLCSLPICRTLWSIPAPTSCKVLSLAISILLAGASTLESIEKRHILGSMHQHLPKESLQGIWGHAFFAHTITLFRMGYSTVLRLEDVPEVDDELRGQTAGNKLEKAWNISGGRHRLIKATFRAYRWSLLSAVLPRLLLSGFLFTQPFLITATLRFVQNPRSARSQSFSPALVGAYVLSYLGLALSTALYWRQTNRCISIIRAGLISKIYHHTLSLDAEELEDAAAITMMGTDVERIVTSLKSMHEAWASALQVGIAIWLLQRQVGLACLIPVLIATASVAAVTQVSARSAEAQKAWIEKVQARLSVTSSILKDTKAMHFLGLNSILFGVVSRLRKLEIRTSQRFRKLLIWQIALSNVPEDFAPFATFAVYAAIAVSKKDSSILAERAFTSLALISLLTSPLLVLCQALPALYQTAICFGRIESYCHNKCQLTNSERTGIELQRQSRITSSAHCLISFNHATIAKSLNGPAVLQGLNLVLKPGITVITGHVASGKSTFLEACLGECYIRHGSVLRSYSNAAYCPQVPWIEGRTVRENILGASKFDAEWFDYSIWASGLEEDFATSLRGGSRVAGSNGKALSGGQKQRVALARAIYSKHDVVLLDDIFTGVDQRNVTLIAERIFGKNGYFRSTQRSVVIATSSLDTFRFAEDIIILDTGSVIKQGPYEYVKAHLENLPESLEDERDRKSLAHETSQYVSRHKSHNTERPNSTESGEDLNAELDLLRQTGSWSVYTYYFRTAGYSLLTLFSAFTMIECFCSSFSAIWLQWWVEANEQRPNQRLGMYLGVYGLLVILSMVAMITGCWILFVNILNRSSINLHSALLKAALFAPITHSESVKTGTTINRFSQDLELVDMQLPIYAVQFASATLVCFIRLIILCAIGRYLAASVPLFLLIVYLLQSFYLRTSRQIRLLDIEAKAPLYTHFIESIQGIVSIRAFGWKQPFSQRSDELLDQSQKPLYMLFCIQQWLTLVLDLIVGGMAVILVTIVTNVNGFKPAEVGVALNLLLLFNQSLAHAIKMWTMMETSIGAVSRIEQFVKHTPAEDDHGAFEISSPSDQWTLKGIIEFDRVEAGYDAQAPILKGISVKILPGSRTLICGTSGSGKTTLLAVLLRMLPAHVGQITINEIDLSTLPSHAVRAAINVIPQDPFFLHGSVRFNIDPQERRSDDELLEALSKVRLKDKVVDLGGLSQQLDVSKWSTGQRQLLSLARSLLRDGNILVLDEATSSLDARTATLMQDVIEKEFSRHTVLAVTHQMRFLEWYTHAIVMEDGHIVRQGGIEVLKDEAGKL